MTQGNRSGLLKAAAIYTVDRSATCLQVRDDASIWLLNAVQMVRNVAMQLHEEGSDLQANPKDAAHILYGIATLIELSANVVSADVKCGNTSAAVTQ